MRWLLGKVDTLTGAVFTGAAGAALSQLSAFIQQYLQRLGGHLDEARRNYDLLLGAERYRQLDQAAREILANDALARVNEIQGAHDAIVNAGLFARPFVFLRHLDTDVAERTLAQFKPALPVDTEGLVYAGLGLVLGLALYELLKLPFAAAFRHR